MWTTRCRPRCRPATTWLHRDGGAGSQGAEGQAIGGTCGRPQRWTRLGACCQSQQGSAGLALLVLLLFMVLLGWALSSAVALHSLQAAQQSRARMARELAQAGVEEAAARIQAGGLSAPANWSRTESLGRMEGRIDVTVEAGSDGTYRVRSVGVVPANGPPGQASAAAAEAELVPPVPPFVMLARGDVAVHFSSAVDVGGTLTVQGDILSGGSVSLAADTAAGASSLVVEGDVRAQKDVRLEAGSAVLASATTEVQGDVVAGGKVTLDCQRGVGTGNTVAVDGTIYHAGGLEKTKSGVGLLDACGITVGGEGAPPGGVAPAASYQSSDTAYCEALVDELEAAGALPAQPPGQGACGTHTTNVRVTGDLSCAHLEVAEGAVVVVDGALDVTEAQVDGLLYVRGGSTPQPDGHVSLGTLSLLQVLSPRYPASGGGALVATGNVHIGAAKLISLLSGGGSQGPLLQVLALATGPADANNDIRFGLGGVIVAAEVTEAPPLLLYTAAGGDIEITDAGLAEALTVNRLPLAVVAGGNITVDSTRLAGLGTGIVLAAEPVIWEEAPPPLRALGRVRVRNWQWTGATAGDAGVHDAKTASPLGH